MSESKDTGYLRQATGTTEMEYTPYMKAVERVCDEADALRAQLSASEQALAKCREDKAEVTLELEAANRIAGHEAAKAQAAEQQIAVLIEQVALAEADEDEAKRKNAELEAWLEDAKEALKLCVWIIEPNIPHPKGGVRINEAGAVAKAQRIVNKQPSDSYKDRFADLEARIARLSAEIGHD